MAQDQTIQPVQRPTPGSIQAGQQVGTSAGQAAAPQPVAAPQPTPQQGAAVGEALGAMGAQPTTAPADAGQALAEAMAEAGLHPIEVPQLEEPTDTGFLKPIAEESAEIPTKPLEPEVGSEDQAATTAGEALGKLEDIAALQTRTPTAGTDRFSAMLRETSKYLRDEGSAINTYEQSNTRQTKPLSQRQELQDHYNIEQVAYDPATDTYTLRTNTVGAVVEGEEVGRHHVRRQRTTESTTGAAKPKSTTGKGSTKQGTKEDDDTYEVRGSDVAKAFSSSVNFFAYLDGRTPLENLIGGVGTYYNVAAAMAGSKEERERIGKGQQAYNAVASNYNLYTNWGRYNDFSRFLKTARTLESNARALGYGEELFGTRSGGLTGLGAAANGIGVLNFGYSTYQMLENWDRMDSMQRAGAVLNSISSGIDAYQGAQAIGNYLNSVGTTAATTGTAAAGTGAAAAGTGAAAGGTTAAVGGTTAVASGGGTGAAAAGSGAAAGETAAAAGGETAAAGTPWMTYLSWAAAIYAAYNIIDQWGTGGADGRANGAASGAAIGTAILPGIGTAIGAVVGLAIGSIKTGKANEQGKRDSYREHYIENKVFEKVDQGNGKEMYGLQLADGTFYDVGIDGQGVAAYGGQDKTFKNDHLIAERDRKGIRGDGKLRPYEVDYTSDLDFATSMATRGLNLFVMGGSVDNRKMSEATQMNGYLTNAATSNLASRDFNEENFNGSMANVRQFYSKMGIDSKEEGIELANALYQSGRMTKNDFNTVMIGLEFAFGGDFSNAQAVMAEMGREGPEADRQADTATMEEFKEQENQQFDETVGKANQYRANIQELERLEQRLQESEQGGGAEAGFGDPNIISRRIEELKAEIAAYEEEYAATHGGGGAGV